MLGGGGHAPLGQEGAASRGRAQRQSRTARKAQQPHRGAPRSFLVGVVIGQRAGIVFFGMRSSRSGPWTWVIGATSEVVPLLGHVVWRLWSNRRYLVVFGCLSAHVGLLSWILSIASVFQMLVRLLVCGLQGLAVIGDVLRSRGHITFGFVLRVLFDVLDLGRFSRPSGVLLRSLEHVGIYPQSRPRLLHPRAAFASCPVFSRLHACMPAPCHRTERSVPGRNWADRHMLQLV